MATSCACYNHDDRRAVWSCFDCKPDCIIKFCKECHEHVHSLPVFRFHKTESIVLTQGEKRRLSQDVSDLEKLVVVEREILNGVLTKLQYVDQQEREMLHDMVKKSEKRLHEIQQCHEKVDKALRYLAKVSTFITSCSSSGPDAFPSQFIYKEPVRNFNDIAQELSDRAELGSISNFPVEIVGSLNKSGCFWMVKKTVSDKQKLIQIEHDLKDYFKHNPVSNTQLPALKEGAVCAAKNNANTEFWRVRVDKLCTNEMVKLRYLDFGMQEELPFSCIVDLPPSLRIAPYLAMECCLFPLTSQIALPYEAKWCFKDLTHGKELTASVQSQMIYPQGHSMYHIQLTAVGPPTVNINQKVADMLAQKQLDAEDIPILPKDEQKPKSEVSQNVQEPEHPKVQQLPSKVQPVQENIIKESIVDENADTKKNPEPEKVVNMQDPAILMHGEPVKKYTILRRNSEDKNKKELLTSLPELSIKPPTTTGNDTPPDPGHPTEGTKNDDQVVNEQTSKKLTDSVTNKSHDATKEISNKTPDALANSLQDATEKSVKKLPSSVPEYIPVGFLNDQMYQSLLDEFSTASEDWYGVRSKLRGARFFAVRGNPRQIIEAIKTKVWCVLDERFALLMNQVYREQTAKQATMYFIFVQRPFVVGFMQVVSERKPHPCSVLTPGVLWGQQCRGEFKIKVISINKYRLHILRNENAEVLWRFFSGFPIVQELNFDVAEEIIYRYENLKRQFTILEWGLKNYQQQNAPLKEMTNSQENLSLHFNESSLPKDAPKETRTKNLTEDEDQSNEDWEPDLQAQPAKVAEIYSNISSPPASTSSRVGEEAVEDTEAVPEEANVCPRETVKPLEEDEVFEVEPVKLEEALEEKAKLDDEVEQEEFVSPDNLVDNTKASRDDNQSDVNDSSLVIEAKEQKQPEPNEEFENQKQEPLPINEEMGPSSLNEENTPQATVTQPFSSKDDLLPSYMPYGQAVPGNGDTTMKDQDNITNEHPDMKEHFYVISPPQTPKTDVPNEKVQDVDKVEISKEEREELSQEQRVSSETKGNERVSSTSVSSLTNEVSSSDASRDSPDFFQVAECSQVDADLYDEESFLPVEKGGRYKVFAYKEPDENGSFWVRLVRNDQEEEIFKKFQRTINKIGRTGAPLAAVHLYKNCIFINNKGYSVRGLITKIYGDGEVDVRLIDDGKTTIATVSDLRELDYQYVTCMPPQAFECRLRDKKSLKDKFKKAKKNIRSYDIEIEVTGFNGEVVEVDVITLKLCERPSRHYKPPPSR